MNTAITLAEEQIQLTATLKDLFTQAYQAGPDPNNVLQHLRDGKTVMEDRF